MSTPRALVLRTAGTNCDAETVRALRLAGAVPELLHWNRLIEDPGSIRRSEIVVIPGGFSYGDDVAAGRVFGMELRRGLAGGLARALAEHVEHGGVILGVCNGFQVLVEAGLLDTQEDDAERDIALTSNESNHFECRWVTLESVDCACPWIVPGERMPVPVAHAEGRFAVKGNSTLERLIENRQVALRYVGADGSEAAYPANPNGSVFDIAGLCDRTGRVLGLMPHPERTLDPWQHPHWTRLADRGEPEGVTFYRRMVEAAMSARVG
jgi:phosphoribosylformylglycinamidine synthase subunit PurQ / glutaminase